MSLGDTRDLSRFRPLSFGVATAARTGSRARLYEPACARHDSRRAAENGMVVAQEKIAAQIGADVLKRGGNAVDAAVATGFAMAVTYPRAGNIGGGGFMLIHSAERNETSRSTIARPRRPRPRRDMFLGADGKPDPRKSRDSALGDRRARHGRGAGAGAGEIRLRQIHARRFAAAGDRARARRLRRRRRHRRHAAGLAPAAGALAVLGEDLLAPRRHVAAATATGWCRPISPTTLDAIAAQGPRGFYEGDVAEKLVGGDPRRRRHHDC